MMFLVSSHEPHDPNKFHGKSPDKSLNSMFYKDNSLSKATNSKLKFLKKCQEAETKQQLLVKLSERTEKAKKARVFQEKIEELISTATFVHKASILKLNQSAIIIQKHARGFLVRKEFEDVYINYKESQLKTLTNELENLTFKSFMALGSNTLPAILKIQKFYRRTCFNYKISKLTEFFQVFNAIKTKNAEDNIKIALQVFACRLKQRWQVKISNRSRVLSKVRRALAIISIANYWKKRKYNHKSFKDKILRAKRRFLAMRAREAYQKSLKAGENSQKINEDDLDDLLDEDQRKKRKQKEQLLKEKLKKIQESKLSHGIQNIRLSSYSPLLQLPSIDSPDPKNDKYRIEPTQNFLQKVNKRVGSLNTRCTQLTNPIKVTHKRLQSQNTPSILWLSDSQYTTPWPPVRIPQKVEDLNFLKHTFAFQSKKDCQPEPKLPKTIIKHPRQKYLKKDTVSFSLKKRKPFDSPSKQPWNISMRNDPDYSPSLYNSSFTPSPYTKPINTPVPSAEVKKNINQCSSSVFTIQISTQEASTIDLFHT